jgi:antitoxin (DNA-binding transcriptional repressor) of toxin-antitoxin stability system
MKTVGAEVLQEQCLSLLDELDEDGVIITRGGKPIAKLLPVKDETSGALIGSLRGKIRITGDILSTGERWDAES